MKNVCVRLVRWLLVVLGSMLAGGGLVVHGQIAIAQHLREEVASSFFLWRTIGRLTFSLQSEVTQTAFVFDDIPQKVLDEAGQAAWALVVVGVAVVVLASMIRAPTNPKQPKRPKNAKQSGKPRKRKKRKRA